MYVELIKLKLTENKLLNSTGHWLSLVKELMQRALSNYSFLLLDADTRSQT